MKKIFLFLLIATGVAIFACNKTTTLPPYTPTIIFSASSKMTHAKDTIRSSGDTIWLTAQGNINDTSRKYGITANLKSADSVTRTLYSVLNIKSITVSFDTTGMAASGLFHWKSVMAFPVPAVATKTKLFTTATFTYSLNLSSQTGNVAATDSKYTYVK